jgi:hypothetical protein
MTRKIPLIAFLGFLLYTSGSAQTTGAESHALSPNQEVNQVIPKKGSFFITSYYEFTQFKDLKLVEHTNYHSLLEGESIDVYLQEDLDDYNNNYGTEYQSGLAGIKLGYQVFEDFGIRAYGGLTHFNFKSWESDENTQYLNTQYPAVSFGGGVDYQKQLYKKLTVKSILSVNYCLTGTPSVSINSNDKVLSSNLKSMFLELDLAVAYPLGKFLPYAGAGYTRQYVNSVYKVQILTTDDVGNDFYNETEFDSHFKGSAFYGFIGLDYRLNKGASVYLRSSFPNPLRTNLGFNIFL